MHSSSLKPRRVRAMVAGGLALAVFSLPLAAQAAWTCTNEAGKVSFQDRPCEAKAPSDKWQAVKANELTPAGAIETLRRFDGAVNARDMASAGRLLSRNFTSIQIDKRGRSEVGRVDYLDALTRAVQASKRYQRERRCGEASADALSQSLRYECRSEVRADVMRRSSNVESVELVRLVLEGGEIKIAEISDRPPRPADAAASAR